MTPTDKLRELLAAATPGPWRNGKLYDSIVADYLTLHDDKMSCEAYGGHLVCESAKMKANAALIAMAPDLSAEVIRLRTALQRIADGNVPLDRPAFVWHDKYQSLRDFARKGLEDTK